MCVCIQYVYVTFKNIKKTIKICISFINFNRESSHFWILWTAALLIYLCKPNNATGYCKQWTFWQLASPVLAAFLWSWLWVGCFMKFYTYPNWIILNLSDAYNLTHRWIASHFSHLCIIAILIYELRELCSEVWRHVGFINYPRVVTPYWNDLLVMKLIVLSSYVMCFDSVICNPSHRNYANYWEYALLSAHS